MKMICLAAMPVLAAAIVGHSGPLGIQGGHHEQGQFHYHLGMANGLQVNVPVAIVPRPRTEYRQQAGGAARTAYRNWLPTRPERPIRRRARQPIEWEFWTWDIMDSDLGTTSNDAFEFIQLSGDSRFGAYGTGFLVKPKETSAVETDGSYPTAGQMRDHLFRLGRDPVSAAYYIDGMSQDKTAWAHMERDGRTLSGRFRHVTPAELEEAAPFVHRHPLHIWQLKSGTRIRGRFVGRIGGQRIHIRRVDGMRLRLFFNDLSQVDLEYLAEIDRR